MERTGWQDVRRALEGHAPALLPEPVAARAAVALILREAHAGLEVLFILRAEHPEDRWSGQVGFPGGRAEAGDPDLQYTAVRETAEELGLDLSAQGAPLGRLDDVRAVAQGRPVDLAISPFVFRLHGPAELTLNEEVRSAHWLSLDELRGPALRSSLDYDHGGTLMRLPCFRAGELVIWGLTFRMFKAFRELLDADASRPASCAASD